jgi:CheY-like chemotaxis protein
MKPSLLVVEDNALNQKIIHEQLLSLGYTVQLVEDGQAALEAFKKSKFALVLMDCEMPVMDGFAATKEIRAFERQQGSIPVPIIALSGHSSEDIRFLAIKAGMNELVTKPIVTEELATLLQTWLTLR